MSPHRRQIIVALVGLAAAPVAPAAAQEAAAPAVPVAGVTPVVAQIAPAVAVSQAAMTGPLVSLPSHYRVRQGWMAMTIDTAGMPVGTVIGVGLQLPEGVLGPASARIATVTGIATGPRLQLRLALSDPALRVMRRRRGLLPKLAVAALPPGGAPTTLTKLVRLRPAGR